MLSADSPDEENVKLHPAISSILFGVTGSYDIARNPK
jgi:hypothetical protein